ncbi:membrane-bound lytic murein transglycosylase D [Flexibacter flexilis DSM 6793]|uniref:Membrane-bound lytic murein transglycosylase D n=1 Tax=Flexibacter flexilis DSM 6793 TaxID=927664 RepID=A0A1I1E1Z4_9BACT|nr:lytic transglycosylase domain-containing protein [Flexibacter flexilis]SFB78883.1 membrane-bound lytic murein transglycosylase D [Flexibacter flexilis DSM 6793]
MVKRNLLLLVCCWGLGVGLSYAQSTTVEEDTAVFSAVPEGDVIEAITEKDTISVPSLTAQMPLLPFPTGEMLADRLHCIESKIPLMYNKAVGGFIHYFTVRKRNYSQTMLERLPYYFPIFEACLAKYGLPDELKYLSIVESGLNPRAVSRSGAVGLWQFMPATGYDFSLQQSIFVDERMDIHKSTEAACKYLRYLYNQFGDWHLALAAYNCGPGNIRKAQARSGKYHFWDIYDKLPAETRSYVPQFMAVVYTMNYAKEHSLFPDADSTLVHIPFDTVQLSHFVHIDSLADQLQVSVQHLKLLNPSLRKYATPHQAEFALKIPSEKITHFEALRDSLAADADKQWLAWQAANPVSRKDTPNSRKIFYTVCRKDNLAKIASKFGVKSSEIKRWNVIRNGKVKTGQMLVIWKKSKSSRQFLAKAKGAKGKKRILYSSARVYKVQQGDTLTNIAGRYEGVSVSDIIRVNNLKGGALKPGQKLIISV